MLDGEFMKTPDEFKPESAGAQLWQWLEGEFEGLESCRPLALELCRISQRLSDVREKIAVQGLTVSGVRGRSVRNPLLDTEMKLASLVAKMWRALGLADKTPDDLPASRVGKSPADEANEKLWRD